MRRVVIVALFFIPACLYSLDIAVIGGISNFTYSEEKFRKDNIYDISCLIVGPAVYIDMGKYKIFNYLGYQLPNEVTFIDALGEDPTNYIENKFFYGFNNKLGIVYPFEFSKGAVSPGAFINFDYIYLKDQSSNDEFIFSVLGNGVSLDLELYLTKKFSVGGVAAIAYNYLSLNDMGNEFKYSYNYYLNLLLKLRL